MSTRADQTRRVELERLQAELQQRERAIVELAYVRRADGIEGVRDAIRRLGELGSPFGIIARACEELGTSSQFDRILLSDVAGGRIAPLRIWERERSATLPECALALEYPLIEHDVVRDQQARLVDLAGDGARSPAALADALGWRAYAVAPIVVEGRVIGLLHADAGASARALDEVDREVLVIAATGLAEVFDRAVLRETLRRHRAELQSAVGWLNGRLRSMAGDRPGAAGAGGQGVDREAIDALTTRELEILTLMARGQTNAAIAQALVVREGTVKYHVKNVLRKLGARSRADAVARYVRATGSAPR